MGKAVKITKDAKDTTFIGCKIVGETENSGKNTKFIKTELLKDFPAKHPKIFWGLLIGTTTSILGTTIYNNFF